MVEELSLDNLLRDFLGTTEKWMDSYDPNKYIAQNNVLGILSRIHKNGYTWQDIRYLNQFLPQTTQFFRSQVVTAAHLAIGGDDQYVRNAIINNYGTQFEQPFFPWLSESDNHLRQSLLTIDNINIGNIVISKTSGSNGYDEVNVGPYQVFLNFSDVVGRTVSDHYTGVCFDKDLLTKERLWHTLRFGQDGYSPEIGLVFMSKFVNWMDLVVYLHEYRHSKQPINDLTLHGSMKLQAIADVNAMQNQGYHHNEIYGFLQEKYDRELFKPIRQMEAANLLSDELNAWEGVDSILSVMIQKHYLDKRSFRPVYELINDCILSYIYSLRHYLNSYTSVYSMLGIRY